MIITPSNAISRIEADKDKINKGFEQLRYVTSELIEMGIPEIEFVTHKPPFNLGAIHGELIIHDGLVEKCIDSIRMLKAFNNGKRRPSEETINSVQDKLVEGFCFISNLSPDKTLEMIDLDKAETNKKLDQFKHVCVVMKDYGITDSDYWKALENRFYPNTRHKSMVEYAYSEKMVEALDLANYIEASDFKPYKSWLDRLFRNKQMDATLKAALNRILELYVMVTT